MYNTSTKPMSACSESIGTTSGKAVKSREVEKPKNGFPSASMLSSLASASKAVTKAGGNEIA